MAIISSGYGGTTWLAWGNSIIRGFNRGGNSARASCFQTSFRKHHGTYRCTGSLLWAMRAQSQVATSDRISGSLSSDLCHQRWAAQTETVATLGTCQHHLALTRGAYTTTASAINGVRFRFHVGRHCIGAHVHEGSVMKAVINGVEVTLDPAQEAVDCRPLSARSPVTIPARPLQNWTIRAVLGSECWQPLTR